MLRICALLSFICVIFPAKAQQLPDLDSLGMMLLPSPVIQMEATFGIDNMYNFHFEVAEGQFRWLKNKYPAHPLPYFLLGMSSWWKMMPDLENTRYDPIFMAYMDSTIYYAEKLYKANEANIEAAFFLSTSYAFKSRLYSERSKWKKATVDGKRALNYLEKCKDKGYLSPELLFGDALYNYYSVWIPENYPALKPIMLVFPKGNKALGLKQLEQVCQEAFYTRVEGSLFLMRIYAIEEKRPAEAFRISEYLHQQYPENPYFHRFYARMLFATGRRDLLKAVSTEILARIDSGRTGYEENSGRYAAYYLGSMSEQGGKVTSAAKHYYERVVYFSEHEKAYESGYYHGALYALGRFYEEAEQYEQAKPYFDKLLEHVDKKTAQRYYDEAKDFKKAYKKRRR